MYLDKKEVDIEQSDRIVTKSQLQSSNERKNIALYHSILTIIYKYQIYNFTFIHKLFTYEEKNHTNTHTYLNCIDKLRKIIE